MKRIQNVLCISDDRRGNILLDSDNLDISEIK